MGFTGKVVLVTGSSRGIGKATAKKFAQKGASVVVHYHSNKEGAEETAEQIKELGRDTLVLQANVSNFDEVDKLMSSTINEFGKLDVLVNNAGITEPKPFSETSKKDWDNMIDINLNGVYYCCKKAIPHMKKENSGSIINLSSVVGRTGAIGAGVHYCAAKAGVIGFTKALAHQVAKEGITVNAVAPGMINTRMIQWRSPELMEKHVSKIPVGRVGETEEIASAICYLASGKAEFITGHTLDVNGGMYMN